MAAGPSFFARASCLHYNTGPGEEYGAGVRNTIQVLLG